jgi:prepilin-type N-terminal cleavage/methylation domain-containing protein
MIISPSFKTKRGFTLLEIVITIIIAAILGSILVQYLGTGFIHSGQSVNLVQDAALLTGVLEKMTADYNRLSKTASDPLAPFKLGLENGNVSANDPYYGEYKIEAKYISFSGGVEIPAPLNDHTYLKVTITTDTARSDQSLMVLFSKEIP